MTREEIMAKDAVISKAEETLLKEFVGIDNVIHEIMRNVRMWYLFPETLEKPMVISLFGLTGCGKTSLVRRLIELLGVEKDARFLNAQDATNTSCMDFDLDEDGEVTRSNMVFVFDEFQHSATVNKQGEDLYDKGSIPELWELIDSGMIKRKLRSRWLFVVDMLLFDMASLEKLCHVEIEDGIWKNRAECTRCIPTEYVRYMGEYFNLYISSDEDCKEEHGVIFDSPQNRQYPVSDKPSNKHLLNDYALNTLYEVEKTLGRKDALPITDIEVVSVTEFIKHLSFNELNEYIRKLKADAQKGYTIDIHNSLIFVMGNIDEAYMMSFDVNPDMDPDSFRKVTEKLTIVDIKEALQNRFRNEQIARLGNTIIAYPSFSNDDFKRIIGIHLDKYASKVKDLYGYTLEYDQSVNDMIYKESVFPTHGTRPILSTIQEVVKSKLPYAVKMAYEKDTDISRIKYSFSDGNTVIECWDTDGNSIGTESVKEVLRIDSHRNSDADERQAIAAVHESGHFAVYLKLFHMLPEKLCSKSVSKDAGGFLMRSSEEEKNYRSMEGMRNSIAVSLAGLFAERMVFGEEHRSTGASEDMQKATVMASEMVRCYGYKQKIPVVRTYLEDGFSTNGGHLIKDASSDTSAIVNTQIYEIIDDAMEICKGVFKDEKWLTLFKEASKYMSCHTSMPKEVMAELYNNAVGGDIRKKNEYYRSCLESFSVRATSKSVDNIKL